MAAACTKESHRNGTLLFNIAEDKDTQVSAQTKSLSDTELGNFTVTVTGAQQTGISDVLYSSIRGQEIILTAGAYTASAQNCTEAESESSNSNYGCIRYWGETDFSIAEGELTRVTVSCNVTNSKISVLLKENFLSVFDMAATTVTVSKDAGVTERALQFSNFAILSDSDGSAVAMTNASATESRYAFYPSGCSIYITISTVKTDSATSQTTVYKIDTPVETIAATWHKISIDADLSNAPQTPTGITVKINSDSQTIDNGFSIDGYNNGSLTEDE